MDIEKLKKELIIFANKNNLLIEIKGIEKRIDEEEDYKKIDNKPYITLYKNIISYGVIIIIKEDIDEEEWETVDYNTHFYIDINDYESIDNVMEDLNNKIKLDINDY
jgi:hypothetical protein